MVTFHIEKPSLLDNEEEALKEYCNMESPALSFDAFNNQQKRRLRYNVADLFVKIVHTDHISRSGPYLAMHYFDRFISVNNNLPILAKNEFNYRWRITAICCLGLALKIRTNSSFTYRRFLANKTPKLIVDVNGNDILKVEILILRALDYNLRSVTALCFRSYFESLVAEPNVKPNVKEIIVQSHGDIRLARYNPSIVAASAVLASYYKDPACLQALLQGRVHLDENNVDYCARLIFDMCNQKLIPLLERNIVAGETSAEKPRKRSSSDTEEEQAEALLDTEEDHAEPLPHRPGKEPMFKEETGTNAFKIMAELMDKDREHKKRENKIDVGKVMADVVKEAGQSKEEKKKKRGETSAEKPRKSSSSDTEEEQAEALLDTEEDHAEPLPHRPGKEPMFKEETGTNAFKLMAELMDKAREHKKRENRIDVSKVMADVVKEPGQSKEEKKIKRCEKVMEEFKLELKWMMGVKEEELILDPSQFPNSYESDSKQKSKGGKMKFILSKFKCCVKIDKDKQD